MRVTIHLSLPKLPHQACELPGIQAGDVPDSLYSVCEQPFFRFLADPEQVPDTQRPHLFFHLLGPKGVYLVRLFEIRSHLCEQFVGSDSDVYGEAQGGLDLILQAGSDVYRILAVAAEAHVDETLIYAELLEHG